MLPKHYILETHFQVFGAVFLPNTLGNKLVGTQRSSQAQKGFKMTPFNESLESINTGLSLSHSNVGHPWSSAIDNCLDHQMTSLER